MRLALEETDGVAVPVAELVADAQSPTIISHDAELKLYPSGREEQLNV